MRRFLVAWWAFVIYNVIRGVLPILQPLECDMIGT